MRLSVFAVLALLLAGLACQAPELTATLTPGSTPSPAPSPTVTASPAPTRPPVVTDNLFSNPGFEGRTRSVIFPEVNVVEGWAPFYCDTPYTPERCPAQRIAEGENPPGLLMGRPEFKPAEVEIDASRVYQGAQAQQWFCFYRACQAGVFQVVTVPAGAECTISAQVQSWSADVWPGEAVSTFPNDDAYENSQWRIRVDLAGGGDAFAPGLLASAPLTYADGHYDQFAELRYTFRTGDAQRVTVFFENLRLYPVAFNDSYIDAASLICARSGQTSPAPTPTPRATGTPPRATPWPDQAETRGADISSYECFTFVPQASETGVRLRRGPSTSEPIITVLQPGSYAYVLRILTVSAGERWYFVFVDGTVDAYGWLANVFGGTELTGTDCAVRWP